MFAKQYQGFMFHLPLKTVVANFKTFLLAVPGEFWWLGLAFVLLGGVLLCLRDRRLFAATAVMFAIAAIWFSNYDIPWEIDIYYLPAIFVMLVWLAFGLNWVLERVPKRAYVLAAGAAFLVPALALATNFADSDLSKQGFIRDVGMDVLDQLPPHAVVLLPATNPTFMLIYLTQVEHLRPDVELWSRQPHAVLPVKEAVYPPEFTKPIPEGRFVVEHLAQGEPVFAVERVAQSTLAGFAQVPWGCLYRLVPAAERAAWLARAPEPGAAKLRFDPERQEFRFGDEHMLIASRYLLVRGDYEEEKGAPGRADQLYQEGMRVGQGLPALARPGEETASWRASDSLLHGKLTATLLGEVAQRDSDYGRYGEAIGLYQRALALKDDADIHARLGSIYGRERKMDQAKAEFLQAIKLKPDLADAHANLASVYGSQEDLPEAISELELAIKYDPNHLQALKNLSFAYLQSGRAEEARPLLERAVALDPEDAQVQTLLQQMR